MLSRSILIASIVFGIPWFYPANCEADIIYDDGGTYTISTSLNQNVYVDQDKPGIATHVTLTSTGSINFPYGFYAYEDSIITITGGDIQGRGLNLSGNCQMTMTGGDFSSAIHANGNATFSISGGSCASYIGMHGNSSGTISYMNANSNLFIRNNSNLLFMGGSIGENIFAGSAYLENHSSLIQFAGSDFKVNDISVPIGSSIRAYATTTVYDGEPCLTGRLTGTLANGGSLDNIFYIYDDSDIVVVPEPLTLLIFVCGVPLIRKRNA